jgi:hypothetical protein
LQAYGLLGQIFVRQKRIGDAKQEYAAVLKQRPRSVPAHTMLGLLAEAENDIPKAIEWYQKGRADRMAGGSRRGKQPRLALCVA